MASQRTPATSTVSEASLLGLPAELRLRIYEFYLEDLQVPLRRQLTSQTQPNDSNCRQTILGLCATVRREIRTLFLRTVTFDLREVLTESEFTAWLDALGEEAVSNLRKLKFRCEGKCSPVAGMEDDADEEGQEEGGTDFCYRKLDLDLTAPEATQILDIRGWHAMDLCDCSDEELTPFCSYQALPCLGLNCAAQMKAVQQFEWREDVPVVTKESLLRVWALMCQDTGQAMDASDGDEEE